MPGQAAMLGSGRSGRITKLEETWIRGSKFVRPSSTLPSRKKRSHVVRKRGEEAVSNPRRDLRLHNLLQKASGTKPMGLRTFSSTQSLRRPPKFSSRQKNSLIDAQQKGKPRVPVKSQSIPRLDIDTLKRHNSRTKTAARATPNIQLGSNLLKNSEPFAGAKYSGMLSAKTPISNFRPTTTGSSYRQPSGLMWTEREQGPSTLRRKVENCKRSEWAQIVSRDIEAYHDEQAYVKMNKRKAALQYAKEIRNTIAKRAEKNNPDIEKAEKLKWNQVLQKEQESNNVVRRTQLLEKKRHALSLKRDRDEQVAQIRARREKEKEYHSEWNAKIIADAQESVKITAAARTLKARKEKKYIQDCIKEHSEAKSKRLAEEAAKREEEQRLIELHSAHVKGKYVTEAERRRREFNRIDSIQRRQMELGKKWVGADQRKRQREQAQFQGMIDGGASARARGGPRLEGREAELYAMRLMRERKKKSMANQRRHLLKQMIEKKERKMEEKVREADFALRAAGESVKAGMYVAYEVEAKAKKKNDYAQALKKQMMDNRKRNRDNPEGIAARMTEAEKTLNAGLLSSLGISSDSKSSKPGRTKKLQAKSKRKVQTPSSQIFLGTYEDVRPTDSSVPRLNSKRSQVEATPFAVEAGAKFDGYRRSGPENSAHAKLMSSRTRPGTSDASLYSSLRAGGVHHPRRSKPWFDDER